MAEDNEIHLGMDDTMGGFNPVSAPMQESKIRYPVIHYEGPEELELPEEGTAKVHFHVIREVEERKAGKDWYQCDIELHWLSNVKKAEGVKEVSAPAKSYGRDTEDALDKLRDEKMAEKEEDEDEEGD